MGIRNKSGGIGKKILSVKAIKDKMDCEYLDLDLLSRNFFIFLTRLLLFISNNAKGKLPLKLGLHYKVLLKQQLLELLP